jgi:prepilin signal peptidase PulO-like enzyme (type II secretory pathway)
MPPQFEGRPSPARGIAGPAHRRACRKASPIGESCVVDVAAGLVGLAVGIVVGPVADRLATNAPRHDPLLGPVPRSPRLLLVTAATAVLGGACGLVYGFSLDAVIATVFCWVLVIVTRSDFETRLIPDKIILPGAVLVLGLRTIDDPSVEWILCALGAGLVLFLIVLVYPRGLGLGDVKLSAFLGAGLGISVVVAMFVGFFVAFVPALVLLVRHGREARKKAIPLGPFLALGGVVALFWGDAILDWYRTLST